MTTLSERAAELTNAAERIAARKAAAADSSALSDALEQFRRQRLTLQPASGRAVACREHGLAVTLPTNGARITRDLRAFADRIDTDPTAVRNRRELTDRVEGFVELVRDQVEAVLSAHVRAARGNADAGFVPSLRSIGLDAAAETVKEALDVLRTYDERLPHSTDELRAIDEASERIERVLAEVRAPEKAPLMDFMRQVSHAPLPLDKLDPALLAQLNASGAARNFVIRARGAA